MRLGFEGGRAAARTLLKEGDQRFIALSWGSKAPPLTFTAAYDRLVARYGGPAAMARAVLMSP